jgi:hypothetical protein
VGANVRRRGRNGRRRGLETPTKRRIGHTSRTWPPWHSHTGEPQLLDNHHAAQSTLATRLKPDEEHARR